MKSFGELLTEYMLRTGISDSEMARHLGVSRQTIFRWKEGTTSRPRDRQDVIKCAERLRLTPTERDSLLLAAGIAPEMLIPPATGNPLAPADANSITNGGPAITPNTTSDHSLALSPAAARHPGRWLAAVGLLLVTVIILAGLALFLPQERQALISLVVPPTATPPPPDRLISIAQLSSRGGTAPPYDVTAQLRQALESEIQAASLTGVRLADHADQVRDEERAEQLRARSAAHIMLWGNFSGDSARVQIDYAPCVPGNHHNESLVPLLPRDLSVALDMRVAEQVRALARLILVPLYLDRQGNIAASEALETAAALEPALPEMRAALEFYRGYLAQTGDPRNPQAAVEAYSRNLRTSSLYESFVNRGLAYLALNNDDAARADFSRAQQLNVERPEAWRAACWAFALKQQPQAAMPFCQAATARDVTAWTLDTRGIVYAELGRYAEAANEFENFIRWLDMQPGATRDAFAPTRLAWIETLRAGKNPFDAETLNRLRGTP